MFLSALAVIGIFIGIVVYTIIGAAGIIAIVIAVDGGRYGGPRFKDWRDPVFTIGGVLIFVSLWVMIPLWILRSF